MSGRLWHTRDEITRPLRGAAQSLCTHSPPQPCVQLSVPAPERESGPSLHGGGSWHMVQHTGTGNQHSPVGSCSQHRAHRAAWVRFPSGVAAAGEEPPGEAEGSEESWIPLGSRDEFSCVHSCSCYHGTSAESGLGRKDEIRMFCFLLLGTQHWRRGVREILLWCARGAIIRDGLGESRGVLEAVPPGKGDTQPLPHPRKRLCPSSWATQGQKFALGWEQEMPLLQLCPDL